MDDQKTEPCSVCEGKGHVPGAYGTDARCAPCQGTGEVGQVSDTDREQAGQMTAFDA